MIDYIIFSQTQPQRFLSLMLALESIGVKDRAQKLWDTPTWDAVTNQRIDFLHPAIKEEVRVFINTVELKLGIRLRLVSGLRTWQEQNDLYAQGRTKDKNGKIIGKIVTFAKGGQSNHNYGLAFDVVPMVGGEPAWNTTEWEKIAAIGKALGFSWGGDWSLKKRDRPHFQKLYGKTLSDLQSLYESGKRDGNYVCLS